jgi:hypothetical protein
MAQETGVSVLQQKDLRAAATGGVKNGKIEMVPGEYESKQE